MKYLASLGSIKQQSLKMSSAANLTWIFMDKLVKTETENVLGVLELGKYSVKTWEAGFIVLLLK